jgi:hypothetical protein
MRSSVPKIQGGYFNRSKDPPEFTDEQILTILSGNEKRAWNHILLVTTNFLGNNKDEG